MQAHLEEQEARFNKQNKEIAGLRAIVIDHEHHLARIESFFFGHRKSNSRGLEGQ